jgi:hypothetical protein
MQYKVISTLIILMATISGCSNIRSKQILIIEYTDHRISISIKDNPDRFTINEKYWINVNVKNIENENITLMMTNGKIYLSTIENYDFMFIPEQIGKFKIYIVAMGPEGMVKYGDVELVAIEK